MQKSNKVSFYVWLLFLISPFFSLVISFRNYKETWAKNILWAFIVFYGYNFVISDEFMDANRYAENFAILHHKEITIENFFSSLLSDEESTYIDFASPVITFIVSRFTDNSAFLFTVFAFVFGYFYTRNLWFFLERTQERIAFSSLLIFLIICLNIPPWSINGFRFWTASHVFIFGLLPYLYVERNKKYLILASLSVIFHFSFIIPVLVVIGSSFLRFNIKILFYVFVGSFLFSSFNLQYLQEFLFQFTPTIFQKKLQTYVNQDYAESIESVKQTTKWFVLMRSDFIKYFTLVLVSVLYYTKLEFIKKSQVYLYVFSFVLYFSLVNNLISFIPSVGRFLSLSYFFAYSFVFLIIQNDKEDILWLKRTIYVALPLIAFYIIFQFRIGFQTINTLTVVGNPLICAFDRGMSVLDFLKK